MVKTTKIKTTESSIKDEAQVSLNAITIIQGDLGAKSKLANNLSRALRNIINGQPKNQLNEPLSEKELNNLLTEVKGKIKSEF